MDNSHTFQMTIYSMCFDPGKSAHVQDNPLHVPMAAYPFSSRPVHSIAWNVDPCYKFLLPSHTYSRWDNSATCQNSIRPTTVQ